MQALPQRESSFYSSEAVARKSHTLLEPLDICHTRLDGQFCQSMLAAWLDKREKRMVHLAKSSLPRRTLRSHRVFLPVRPTRQREMNEVVRHLCGETIDEGIEYRSQRSTVGTAEIHKGRHDYSPVTGAEMMRYLVPPFPSLSISLTICRPFFPPSIMHVEPEQCHCRDRYAYRRPYVDCFPYGHTPSPHLNLAIKGRPRRTHTHRGRLSTRRCSLFSAGILTLALPVSVQYSSSIIFLQVSFNSYCPHHTLSQHCSNPGTPTPPGI